MTDRDAALRDAIESLHVYNDGHQYFIDGFEDCRKRVLELLATPAADPPFESKVSAEYPNKAADTFAEGVATKHPSTQSLDVFSTDVKEAIAYVSRIVVEADGYPLEHSAATMRTLLVNAFVAGRESNRAPAEPPSGWQPIAVRPAPTDGTHFLAVVDGRTRIVSWGKTSHVPLHGFCLRDQGSEDSDFCNFTLWQPLPLPPGEPTP